MNENDLKTRFNANLAFLTTDLLGLFVTGYIYWFFIIFRKGSVIWYNRLFYNMLYTQI